MFLPALVLALLMTQAASTVCGAQCVQHQFPNPSAHLMAHCPSMQQPEPNGPTLRTCQTGTHATCAVDVLANTQGKTASLLVPLADVRSGAHLPSQNVPQFVSASHHLRSSTHSSPLITALRV